VVDHAKGIAGRGHDPNSQRQSGQNRFCAMPHSIDNAPVIRRSPQDNLPNLVKNNEVRNNTWRQLFELSPTAAFKSVSSLAG
jgi:hypothetical protein